MRSMQTEEITDYAMPLMIIEKQTKKVHDLCLDKQYMKAAEELISMEYQLALLRKNLIAMQLEKQ